MTSSLNVALEQLAPLLWTPELVGRPSAWWGHVPFARWLVAASKPQVLVELGTQHGVSYLAFCQAVHRCRLSTRCHAVDLWEGDLHTGFYGNEIYENLRSAHAKFEAFSTLHRETFDQARAHFTNGSIDLLHIDGLHTYEAVRHDYENWISAMSERGVVLFHDIAVRNDDFGVIRLWNELRDQYASFEFQHGHGLGVLAVGVNAPEAVLEICRYRGTQRETLVQESFGQLGQHWIMFESIRNERDEGRAESKELQRQAAATEREFLEERSLLASAERRLTKARDAVMSLRDVRRKNAELEATIVTLRETILQLSTTIAAYRRSSSWRLTMPMRAATTAFRQLCRTALSLLRVVWRPSLIPIKDLYALGGGTYFSTGGDPQFDLQTAWNRPKGGWALIEINVLDARQPLHPSLYVFGEGKESEVLAFRMPAIVRGRLRKLVMVPPRVRSVRLDPTDASGVYFAVGNVAIRRLSTVGLAYYVFRFVLDRTQRKSALRALINCDLGSAKAIVRSSLATHDFDAEYQSWVALYDTLTEADCAAIRTRISALAWRPLISVVMPVYNPRPEYLRKAIDSVLGQLYQDSELCIADDASTNPEVREILEAYARVDSRVTITFRQSNGHVSAATNTALDLVHGEYVALMDHDDMLPPHALYMIAEELNRHPETDLIYTDEDKIDANDRRHNPHFKTDWNRELFYSQNIIAHLGVYRSSLLKEIGGFRVGFEGSQDYDLALRFLRVTTDARIRHIPHVLYHWRIFPGVTSFSSRNPTRSIETAYRCLVEYFAEVEPASEVQPFEKFPGWWRVKRPAPQPLPRVSLIVPTRDRVDLLEVTMNGLLNETDYSNLEIIIVDNESVEPETLAYLDEINEDPRVTVVQVEGDFNFSRLNNQAVRIATGSILGFVNNDVKMINREWLSELVAQVSRPNVGAAGAKLYYPNDTIQHAGVTLGLYGVAAHGHRHLRRHDGRHDVGYFGRPVLVQNVSAVTAACMVVSRHVFEEVDGFNELFLAVGYNDVDLCLKIREAGYNVLFTPFAELYHMESASRGENRSKQHLDRDARERAYMLERWAPVIAQDPFYNPNLTTDAEDFGLAFPPRVDKRWLPGGSTAPAVVPTAPGSSWAKTFRRTSRPSRRNPVETRWRRAWQMGKVPRPVDKLTAHIRRNLPGR